jgi:hypothetical protein
MNDPILIVWNSPAFTDAFPLRRASLSHFTLLKFRRALVAQNQVSSLLPD